MNVVEAQRALNVLRHNRRAYELPIAYYEGRHRLLFASDRFRNVFGDLFRAFADNFCAPVVDTAVERLIFRGFAVDSNQSNAAEAAQALWTFNRMGAQYQHLHTDAMVSKDAYLIVWPNAAGVPIIHLNHPGQVAVVYDQEIPWQVEYAIKVWRTPDKKVRLNMYYRDRVERYERDAGEMQGFPADVQRFRPVAEDPVVPNTWGQVPVFHFPNRGRIGGDGRSELRDAMPVNDAINKLCADMLVASEYVAFPQRWATGIAEERDEITGKPKAPFQLGTERVLTTENEDAKIGQLDAGSFDSPLSLMRAFVGHLAVQTGTPAHAFYMDSTGDWPSGEALKTAEARLVAKLTARQDSWGPIWADALALAVRMNRPQDAAPLQTLWEPAATRSETEELANALSKKALGISLRQIQTELGYSEEQIAEMAVDVENERIALEEAAARARDAGRLF